MEQELEEGSGEWRAALEASPPPSDGPRGGGGCECEEGGLLGPERHRPRLGVAGEEGQWALCSSLTILVPPQEGTLLPPPNRARGKHRATAKETEAAPWQPLVGREPEKQCCHWGSSSSAGWLGAWASSRREVAWGEGVLGTCSPCAIAPNTLNTEQEARDRWKQEGV